MIPSPVHRPFLQHLLLLTLVSLALSMALSASGCARRVLVVSDPPGASVRRNREPLGATPLELRVWWVPFWRQEVRVSMAGYRSVEIPLRRHLGWFPQLTTHEVRLVEEHGPAGTWTEEEAKE